MKKFLVILIIFIESLAFSNFCVAGYTHLSGKEVERLFVGHTIGISNTRVYFNKNGHVGNSQFTYTISEDGKVCFSGGIQFYFHTGRSAGDNLQDRCFSVAKNDNIYLAIYPDTAYEMFFLYIN